MQSYTFIEKTLSKHMIIVILHFGVKMSFFNINSFISQNYWSFTETRVMGKEKTIYDHLSLIPWLFLDSTGVWNLKYKEIRGSGGKRFEEYIIMKNVNVK